MYITKSINELIDLSNKKGIHIRITPLEGFESYDLTVGLDTLFIRVIEGRIIKLEYNYSESNEEYSRNAHYILNNYIGFLKEI